MEGTKRSLILAGGGMRVAYQAGVLRALAEEGITFHHADGTSGGTINLAMMLSGLSAIEMMQRWESLPVRDFVSFMPLEKYLSHQGWAALGDARSLVDRVFPYLGIDMAKIRAAQGTEGTFNVCNFTRKISEVIPHQRMTMDYLVAAISLPIFLPAVEIDGALYMDSVWLRDANLMEAVRRGAEELWVVWCIGNTGLYHNGAFRQYVHMIEIAANGKLFEEFDQINEMNRRIGAGETVYGRRKPIRVHLIKPANALPLDPDYYTGRIDARTLAGRGYADAKQYLARRGEGIALTPEATKWQMKRSVLLFANKWQADSRSGRPIPKKAPGPGATPAIPSPCTPPSKSTT
jgi:predicted acylesterase/phospholipase RssA